MSKDPKDLATLTERLDFLIEETWGSRKACAEALGTNPALVSRWATNPDRTPGEESIQTLARLTASTPWWIRYGIGAVHPHDQNGVFALVDRYSSPRNVLAHVCPEELAGAVLRTALAEGWGEEGVQDVVDFLAEAPGVPQEAPRRRERARRRVPTAPGPVRPSWSIFDR